MKRKNSFISALVFLIDVLSKLFKEIKELGGTEESFYTLKSAKKICEIAKIIVGTVSDLKLKFLELVQSGIKVATSVFNKSRFTKGSVKYYIWDNFQNWILNKAPASIPAFEGTLTKFRLTKPMTDAEIRAEIGEGAFSISEVLAIIAALTERQPNGEEGDLFMNGNTNIFYVQLEDRVVVVFVHWYSDSREWCLHAFDLGARGWDAGHCVFSRS